MSSAAVRLRPADTTVPPPTANRALAPLDDGHTTGPPAPPCTRKKVHKRIGYSIIVGSVAKVPMEFGESRVFLKIVGTGRAGRGVGTSGNADLLIGPIESPDERADQQIGVPRKIALMTEPS